MIRTIIDFYRLVGSIAAKRLIIKKRRETKKVTGIAVQWHVTAVVFRKQAQAGRFSIFAFITRVSGVECANTLLEVHLPTGNADIPVTKYFSMQFECCHVAANIPVNGRIGGGIFRRL